VTVTREPAVREHIPTPLVSSNVWRTAAKIATACEFKLKAAQNPLVALLEEIPIPITVQAAHNDRRTR